MKKVVLALPLFVLLSLPMAASGPDAPPEGFSLLFNGRDFEGWRVPEGDNGHWQVVDGIIDYDAMSEAAGDKNLWTEEEYGDFVLMLDWRIKETPFVNPNVPLIKPDGGHKKNAEGNDIRIQVPDSDSGVFLRGSSKSQINIWSWPSGSGEIYGYRMDGNMPPEVRSGATPITPADRDIGAWNSFVITARGEHVTVELNGIVVIDNVRLPGIPKKGPIALQHHGGRDGDGNWVSSPSLVQFRNIFIREL